MTLQNSITERHSGPRRTRRLQLDWPSRAGEPWESIHRTHVLLTLPAYTGGELRLETDLDAEKAGNPAFCGSKTVPLPIRLLKHTCDTALTSFPSSAFRRLLGQLRRFAADRHAAILLEGESGTGKTVLARHIHEFSPRAARPFQQVVLSTLDDALAGSELFGHVSGAYTDARQSRPGQFATANGGTIFLDEIGKTSLGVQQKLLHVVEYGEFRPIGSDREMRVDVRLVAATNTSLEDAVAEGRFLPDLYARLNAFCVRIPALRERRADIPLLVERYVAKHATACGYASLPTVHPELLEALQQAPWPNNLRQLDAAIHRILIDAGGDSELTIEHCEDERLDLQGYATSMTALTPETIAQAIARAGSVSGAARLLKCDRTTIHRHRKRIANGER